MFYSYRLNLEDQRHFEYAPEARCFPAAARCCSSRCGGAMRLLGLSEHQGPAELLGWEETDEPRETQQGICLRTCNW